MNRKDEIHKLIHEAADELLAFIKESEAEFEDGWVPSAVIKTKFDLNFVAVPANEQYGAKGWLFAILARMLEDRSLLEHKKESNLAHFIVLSNLDNFRNLYNRY
jgi:alkylation response protein AidB-like acyl-CoA dehydrogenase